MNANTPNAGPQETRRSKPPFWLRLIIVGVSASYFYVACWLSVSESNGALGEPGVKIRLSTLFAGLIEDPRALVPLSASIFWLAGAVLLLAGACRWAACMANVAVFGGPAPLFLYEHSELLVGFSLWSSSLFLLGIGSMYLHTSRRWKQATTNHAAPSSPAAQPRD